MRILLAATVLQVFVGFTFGDEVKIIVENEPWINRDVAPGKKRAPPYFPQNPCISQKTCKDCIRAHPECAWCAKKDINYTAGGKARCNFASDVLNECGADDTVEILNTRELYKGGFHAWVKPGDPIHFVLNVLVTKNQPVIGFRDDAPYNVRVIYHSNCSRNEEAEKTNFCRDINKGQNVQFQIKMELLSCPEDRDEWNQTIQFYEMTDDPSVDVSLHMICECDCEKPWNEERNSPKCSNGKGTYHCGICSCHDNRHGKECECEGTTTGDTDYDDAKACIAPHDTKICSGRGRCRCGSCECFDKTSVTGRFCECDSSSCPRSKRGQICGGKDQGECVCGKCECTDEWTGPACDCTKDVEECRSPYNGQICHGFGECLCGRCQCFKTDGELRSGPHCADCEPSGNIFGVNVGIISFTLASPFMWKPQTMINKKDNSGVVNRCVGFPINLVPQNYYCKS